jgi:predicted negative regulator of RcsB-dependent stress response
MKKLVFAVLLSALSTAAYADSCKSQATEKKLAGAALNSFMKKCQTDAQKSCDTSAAAKKLAGAAKTSFTKKCVNDAVGS